MRYLFSLLLALPFFTLAQKPTLPNTLPLQRSTGYMQAGYYRADSAFLYSSRDTNWIPATNSAIVYYNGIYYYYGLSKWNSFASGASADTIVLSTRAWRQKAVDSLNLNIGKKVDTSSAINVGYGLTGGGKLTTSRTVTADSTLLSTKLWRQKGVDSVESDLKTRTDTTVISTRKWRQKGMDSLAALINATSGTVTSITAGYGLTGGTVTATGTFKSDTTINATKYYRQKGIDSVSANVSLRVKYSDTASMLTPYLRDTSVISTRKWRQKGIDSVNTNIALKLNITDTTSKWLPLTGGTLTGSLTATAFYESSDRRLKNIYSPYYGKDYFGATYFYWKKGNAKAIGFIAQDVQKVLPQAVITGSDGYLKVDYIQALVYKISLLEKRIEALEKKKRK
jgi:hypothetical protein